MKILFTRFPLESALGGAEIQTLSLMEGLMTRGHAVGFAGSCPVLLAECKKHGVPTVEWHIGPPPVTKWGTISFAWRKIGMRKKLEQLLAQFSDLDVIAMLSLSEKLLLTDIATEENIKTVWIEHDRIGRWLTKNPWLSLLLQQSKKVTTVAVSDLSRKMYVDMGWEADRVVAIANGIDEKRLRHVETPWQAVSSNNPFHIGCIARLSYEKGVDLLIEAMVQVPDATLEIVGEGRQRSELERLIAKLHLEDRVKLLGRINDLSTVYARIDVLVLPSRDNDPFGLVAAEAMLLGIPVIVTDQCGIAGYVEEGKDVVISQANSVSALAEGIKRTSNVEYRMSLGKEGQKTAKEKFTVERMVDEYEKVFSI